MYILHLWLKCKYVVVYQLSQKKYFAAFRKKIYFFKVFSNWKSGPASVHRILRVLLLLLLLLLLRQVFSPTLILGLCREHYIECTVVCMLYMRMYVFMYVCMHVCMCYFGVKICWGVKNFGRVKYFGG